MTNTHALGAFLGSMHLGEATMSSDGATSAWLKQELTTLLGFPEVDDIVDYVLSTFKTQAEVAPYLTELLGVPAARAQDIGSRLFTKGADSGKGAGARQNTSKQQQRKPAAQQHMQQPLVPKPTAVNSRLKPAKIKKPSKLLHSRIINCLKCGKIEYNGARRCAFCENELRYEELDEELMDPAAQEHMKRLVGYDESGAERTTVLDTEEVFYDEVQAAPEGERYRQPIVLNLDLETRSFETVAPPSLVLTANQELNRDARDLLQSLQKKLSKQPSRGGGGGGAQHGPAHDDTAAVLDDPYSVLYA